MSSLDFLNTARNVFSYVVVSPRINNRKHNTTQKITHRIEICLYIYIYIYVYTHVYIFCLLPIAISIVLTQVSSRLAHSSQVSAYPPEHLPLASCRRNPSTSLLRLASAIGNTIDIRPPNFHATNTFVLLGKNKTTSNKCRSVLLLGVGFALTLRYQTQLQLCKFDTFEL